MVSEALRQSAMDCHRSSTLALPWIWVIETLAGSNQVDTSLLLELVKKVPTFSDDLGKNAREMLSLRILESLFVHGHQHTNPVTHSSISQIQIDPSERCEDVLKKILQQTPVSNLKAAGSDVLKWDIQPFIAHKRCNVPKSSLQKLKDAILTGSHTLLASLKEQSGLTAGNQHEHQSLFGEGNSHVMELPLEDSNKDNIKVGANGHLNPPPPENMDGLSQISFRDKNLTPAKRAEPDTIENVEGENIENQTTIPTGCETLKNGCKRSKHVLVCDEQDMPGTSSSSAANRILPNTSMAVHQIETRTIDQEKAFHVQDIEKKQPPKEGDNDFNTLNKVVGHDEGLPLGNQVLPSEIEVANSKSGNDGVRGIQVNETEGNEVCCFNARSASRASEDVTEKRTGVYPDRLDNEDNFQRSPSNSVEADEPESNHVHLSCDSDAYKKEMTNVSMKKHAFLSSQCWYSQDFLANTDVGASRLCKSCNQGGQLLACSSKTCSVVVHECCLGSAVNFDPRGDFYCPFCAYDRAIANYFEVQKKATLARKDLSSFMSMKTRKPSNKRPQRSCMTRYNQSSQGEYVHKGDDMNNRIFSMEGNNHQYRENLGDDQKAEPSLSCPDEPAPGGERPVDLTSEPPDISRKDSSEGKKMGQDGRSPEDHGLQQIATEELCNPQGDHSSCGVQESSEENKRQGKKKGVLNQLETSRSTHAQEVSDEENDSSSVSKYFIRSRKQAGQYSYPAIPQLRRKKLPWTRMEEETLKEGMRRFCTPHDRNIPWKNILDFGANVFQKGRTTIDLKDKWRNMSKGSPNSK